MNKKLIHLFAEQAAIDPTLAEQATKLQAAEELRALAAGHGVELTEEEAEAALPRIRTLFTADGKLTDDALDTVSGGLCSACDGSGVGSSPC